MLALLGVAAARAAPPTDPYPAAAASYIVVADGRPIWAHEPNLRRQPASLAKLLTALVLLDPDWQPEAIVAVSAEAASIEGSRAGLRVGEELIAKDALTALLVRSANDACVALAEHAAGSLREFAARMNTRARAMGLDSHFVHPCGLDAPDQHSSAKDLLEIAVAAHENPTIARLVSLRGASIRTLAGRPISLHNSDALLGRVDGVIGMKSGYTRGAGKCVIALAVRGPHTVWLVMLDSPNRWWLAAGMLDAAFRSF